MQRVDVTAFSKPYIWKPIAWITAAAKVKASMNCAARDNPDGYTMLGKRVSI